MLAGFPRMVGASREHVQFFLEKLQRSLQSDFDKESEIRAAYIVYHIWLAWNGASATSSLVWEIKGTADTPSSLTLACSRIKHPLTRLND